MIAIDEFLSGIAKPMSLYDIGQIAGDRFTVRVVDAPEWRVFGGRYKPGQVVTVSRTRGGFQSPMGRLNADRARYILIKEVAHEPTEHR